MVIGSGKDGLPIILNADTLDADRRYACSMGQLGNACRARAAECTLAARAAGWRGDNALKALYLALAQQRAGDRDYWRRGRARNESSSQMSSRRFPPPWSVGEGAPLSEVGRFNASSTIPVHGAGPWVIVETPTRHHTR